MEKPCGICEWIKELKKGDPFFVKELNTGFVIISKYQYYRGYTLFLCKQHVTELHELDEDFRIEFLREMSYVGKALFSATCPDKLNYELLGNTEPHLHWHIIPRYKSDPLFNRPIWVIDREIRQAENTVSIKEINKLKKSLLSGL